MDTSQPQTILITGGGGFLGSLLGEFLLKDKDINVKELVLSDVVEPRPLFGFEGDKRVVRVKSDLTKSSSIDELFEGRKYTAICALHGLMSGGSEEDFEAGMAINLDATRAILDKVRSLHSDSTKPPVWLYTSSGAAYGGDLPESGITDATTPAPQGSYGTQKVICEYLSFDYSRRGWIDARSVRLPTIMVRPGKPNTALSSYASNIVREPLKGQKTQCPASLDFALWACSPENVVGNFVHLLKLPGSRYPHWTRTTMLPGIPITAQQILDALEEVGGKKAVDLVEVKPDEKVLKLASTWPPIWHTDRANELGCTKDASVVDIVRLYKENWLDQGRG